MFAWCLYVSSTTWYHAAIRKMLPILDRNTHLPKHLLEIAQLNIITSKVGVPTPCWIGLVDKETIVSALFVHDGRTNESPGRLCLTVKCSIKCCGQLVLRSSSIRHWLLKLVTSSWSAALIINFLVRWTGGYWWGCEPLGTPWWLDGLVVRYVDSCIVLPYHYCHVHCLVTQRLTKYLNRRRAWARIRVSVRSKVEQNNLNLHEHMRALNNAHSKLPMLGCWGPSWEVYVHDDTLNWQTFPPMESVLWFQCLVVRIHATHIFGTLQL
jgi:hypothetical protein